MKAVPRKDVCRRQFRPARATEFDVLVPYGEPLSLKAYGNRLGDVHVDLSRGKEFLRKLHTHEGHRNPGGLLVPGTHMHFPTEQYPLAGHRSSYAYELSEEIGSVSDGVLVLCELLEIEIDAIQAYLGE